MATTIPYVPSGGLIVKTFEQFRKSFPNKVDANVLKKLALAPNNESMVITLLKFLDFIDEEHNRTESATKVFTKHDDAEFAKELKPIVEKAYSELFNLHSENAWNLQESSLISFFRGHDRSSSITGKRQAKSFSTLASLCGYGESPKTYEKKISPKINNPKKAMVKEPINFKDNLTAKVPQESSKTQLGNFGLTVRIEVNLPAQADQETYDKIFSSIRKNLIDGTN